MSGTELRLTSLTVFLPCFNEAFNLSALVERCIPVLDRLADQSELIIVDDGSTDNTLHVATHLLKRHDRIRIVSHRTNRGYGAALISGFTHATGEWVFFTDGDGQFDMDELELLVREAPQSDAVIGYRKDRSDPLHRKLYSRGWNHLVRKFLHIQCRDINCAFKLIRRSMLEDIDLACEGPAINAELLMKLRHRGASIRECAVTHLPRLGGRQTGGRPAVIARGLAELMRLKWKLHTRPRYREAKQLLRIKT